MSDIKKIKEEFLNKLQGNLTLSETNQIKTDLFGKNGIISLEFKKIGQIDESERKTFASDLNEIKNVLQNEIENKISKIEQLEINEKLNKEKIDVTLPTRPYLKGKFILCHKPLMRYPLFFQKLVLVLKRGLM
jgi:phenylalanyl-tRNA synthetase alpha chain